MPDIRSRKSKAENPKIIALKFNELKQDRITEIKSLIKLEVEKVVKKQKEEFHVTVLKFQEWINSTGVWKRWLGAVSKSIMHQN